LDALEVLYDRHHRLALGLARRMLADEQAAEDVVQEVFLAVWRQAERYRPERGAVKTWLLAMVHHRAIDRLRQRPAARAAVELSEQLEDQGMAPVWQQAFEQIRGEQISSALEVLPPEQRETIELAYFGGKSQSEIAALQGVPLGTVKGRTRLALEKLRGLLVGLREEPA
jgi:RNA polymerase sigma-70 factor (ECF subfamily)